eukprot:754162-Hanusia_phi.AAC.2
MSRLSKCRGDDLHHCKPHSDPFSSVDTSNPYNFSRDQPSHHGNYSLVFGKSPTSLHYQHPLPPTTVTAGGHSAFHEVAFLHESRSSPGAQSQPVGVSTRTPCGPSDIRCGLVPDAAGPGDQPLNSVSFGSPAAGDSLRTPSGSSLPGWSTTL